MTELQLNELKSVLRKSHEDWEKNTPHRHSKGMHKKCICVFAYSCAPPACSALRQMIWWHTFVWRLRTTVRHSSKDAAIAVRYFARPEIAYEHLHKFLKDHNLQLQVPPLDLNNPQPIQLFSPTDDVDVKLTVHKVD